MASSASILDRWFRKLAHVDPTSSLRVDRRIFRLVVAFHMLALLACVPYFFSWSGMATAVAGLYVFGTLGINIGFHRLLVHRGFVCPPWLEHCLAVLGVCCLQGSPINWVAVHRMHHQKSDEPGDPHTPRDGLFWSHIGWLLVDNPAIRNIGTYDRYARDMISDRFYKNLERPRFWRRIQMAQWSIFLVMGALVGGLTCALSGGLPGATGFDFAVALFAAALQGSLSWLVWGIFVRTVAVWHITWSVNSLTHVWGYRNYETNDDSRNNWLVGLIGMGEGWHNNHHSNPRCVKNGHRWWELDVSYLTVRVLAMVGLAWDLVMPRPVSSSRPPTEKQIEPVATRDAA